MDLLTVLPTFSIKAYSHILPPLERRHISTVDLISLDYLEIAKRAHVPPADVRRLCADVVAALHGDLGCEVKLPAGVTRNAEEGEEEREEGKRRTGAGAIDLSRWNAISTMDPALDELLGGGIPTGYLTEVTGESGSGKTQFLLNLLLAAQLPSSSSSLSSPCKGLGRKAIYISTEAPLSTPRLSQILETHPYLSKLPPSEKPSLANVLSITAVDLETQDHILNYQLPVAISRFNVGLVVIDSIAANYRAEHASNNMKGLSARSGELAKLGHMLRNMAVKEDVAIVVANQVSDRFDVLGDAPRFPRSSQTPLLNRVQNNNSSNSNSNNNNSNHNNKANADSNNYDCPLSSLPSTPSSQIPADDDAMFDGGYLVEHPAWNETLSLAHQQRFFTGWGDGGRDVSETQKTPALGFVWSTQIACRIALKKEEGPVIRMAGIAPASQKIMESSLYDDYNHGNNITVDIKTARDVSQQLSTPTPPHLHPSTPAPNPTQDVNGHGIHPKTAKDPNKPHFGQNADQQKPPQATMTMEERITRRRIKLVFAPWTSGVVRGATSNDNANENGNSNSNDYDYDYDYDSNEIDFEIWKGGIRSLDRPESNR